MLKGKKIATFIAEGYHKRELEDPIKALEPEGVKFVLIGVKEKHITEGVLDYNTFKYPDDMKPGNRKKADILIKDAHPEDFDGLIISGGSAPEKLRKERMVVEFIRKMYALKKPIAAICHGPQLLISAKIIKGKNIASVSSIAVDIENAGAIYLDEPVVVDGNIITSRVLADIDHFIKAVRDILDEQ